MGFVIFFHRKFYVGKIKTQNFLLLFLELGQGKSYWNRLRFLDTCEFIIEIFSKSFFCKYFFLPAIELTHDPVANVRYGTNPRIYLKKLCLFNVFTVMNIQKCFLGLKNNQELVLVLRFLVVLIEPQ